MFDVFVIMVLKPGLGVDPYHVPGHGFGRITWVTKVN
jgi:hypothetical protein